MFVINHIFEQQTCFNTLEEAKQYIIKEKCWYEKYNEGNYSNFYTYWKKQKDKWVCYTTFINKTNNSIKKEKIRRGTIKEYPFLKVKTT